MKWIKELLPYFIIIVVVILLRTFIVSPVQVDGTSMDPTLKDNQVLLLKKYDHTFKRFDIVIFKYQKDELVKRVIGLPGDHIKYMDHILYVNDEKYEDPFSNITNDFDLVSLGFETIPDDHYFVMGDNRKNSTDSRIIGLISKKDIQGSTSFSIFPFSKFGFIK